MSKFDIYHGDKEPSPVSKNSFKEGLRGIAYEFGMSSVTNFGSNMFSKSITTGWFGIN